MPIEEKLIIIFLICILIILLLFIIKILYEIIDPIISTNLSIKDHFELQKKIQKDSIEEQKKQ